MGSGGQAGDFLCALHRGTCAVGSPICVSAIHRAGHLLRFKTLGYPATTMVMMLAAAYAVAVGL